jgi:serine/threonine protein kinase
MDDASLHCLHCCEPTGRRGGCLLCGPAAPGQPVEPLVHGLPPGARLHGGQYLVGRALGSGGFGITYLGRDLRLSQRVAIKEYMPRAVAARHRDGSTVVPGSGRDRDDFAFGLARFLDEARMLASLENEPNVVGAKNFFEENGTAYLVMPYLDGQSLDAVRRSRGGRLPEREAVPLAMAVLDGLRAVHARGLLHRDIKPQNVYVTAAGQVKLLDFGAARYAAGAQSRSLTAVLTVPYAPFEQYQGSGDGQGPWTDVYAVGVLLYVLLTGQEPPEALSRLDEDGLVPPAAVPGAAVSAEVSAAVVAALAPRARDRLRDADAFLARLAASPAVAAVAAPPPQPADPDAERRRSEERLAEERRTLEAERQRLEAERERLDTERRGWEAERSQTAVAPPPDRARGRRRALALGGAAAVAAVAVALGLGLARGGDEGAAGAAGRAGVVGGAAPAVGAAPALRPAGAGSIPPPDAAAASHPADREEPEIPTPPDGMVGIPAGTYVIGCRETEPACPPDARPRHEVRVEAFAVQQQETTASEYDACVAAGACPPAGRAPDCTWQRSERDQHPINCVDWAAATAYCRWRGWRLPSESEWEVAARGPQAPPYPWGESVPSCAQTRLRGTKTDSCAGRGPSAVGERPGDRSWCGALDLGGNVREWTDTDYLPYPGGTIDPGQSGKVNRGGSWEMSVEQYPAAYTRIADEPQRSRGDLGMRCAVSL